MDAANIEVALKSDQEHQERIASEEVSAAPSAADAAASSQADGDPAALDGHCSQPQAQAFDSLADHQQIFLEEEQPGQDTAEVLLQRLHGLEVRTTFQLKYEVKSFKSTLRCAPL